jgi:hypothetical protein
MPNDVLMPAEAPAADPAPMPPSHPVIDGLLKVVAEEEAHQGQFAAIADAIAAHKAAALRLVEVLKNWL